MHFIPFPRSLGPLAVLALAVLGSCAHPSSGGLVGGGTIPPPPPPPPPPPGFTFDDLMGDWVGQLTPDNPLRLTQNLYLRFSSDVLAEAADSAGNEWRLDNSDRTFDFSSDGLLEANLGLLVGVAGLEILAEMDEAHTVLTGAYVQTGPDLFPVAGTLELVRSSGLDMFDEPMLAGTWSGDITNSAAKKQLLELTLDAAGTVVSGKMTRAVLGTIRRTYSAGAASFTFFDSAIGRFESVVLTADTGETSTFHYLLLDRDATLLGGPGTDSKLGAGIARLLLP